MSSMFESVNFDYRRLIPSRGSEEGPLGVYEDEESRREREEQEEPLTCPDWCSFLPELTLRDRLLGCGVCMVCGYLLSFGSFLRMRQLLGGNPTPLVAKVTLGNILSLCGTCFMSGPTQQSRRMFHKTRRVASYMYLGSVAVTVLLLMAPKSTGKGLVLFLLLLSQYVSITW